jgi:4-amino-4-deoxy-L-arabinose transferase-like glycosyltransferase
MIFSVFILLSLLSFFWAYTRKEHSPQGTILFFVFSGCAVLSKGPLGFIIPFLVVFIFLGIRREWGFKLTRYSLWGLILFLLISLPWYMLMISKYGTVFTSEFFVNDHLRRLIEAEHLAADTWYFYPGSMLMGMFPWSFYLLAAAVLFFKDLKGRKDPIYPFLASWIIVVFLVFQPAHSKLASYIFPMFPALAVLTGDFIYDAAISGRHRRALSVASWATLAFIVFFVFSLAVGVFAFSQYMLKYLSSGIPIYILIVLFILLALFFFEALRRREFIKSAYLLMLFIPMIFSVFPLIVRDIEPYLSLKNSCDYLLKNAKSDGAVLCSKFYVRGVRFYTDKEVAVMNPHGKNFFSPHPVTYLDTDDKVRAFLRSQPVTYGVLKRSSLEDLQRQEPEFKTELLKEIGSEYVVMIAPVKGKKR